MPFISSLRKNQLRVQRRCAVDMSSTHPSRLAARAERRQPKKNRRTVRRRHAPNNASTTRPKPRVDYIEDTSTTAGDMCRSMPLRERCGPGGWGHRKNGHASCGYCRGAARESGTRTSLACRREVFQQLLCWGSRRSRWQLSARRFGDAGRTCLGRSRAPRLVRNQRADHKDFDVSTGPSGKDAVGTSR